VRRAEEFIEKEASRTTGKPSLDVKREATTATQTPLPISPGPPILEPPLSELTELEVAFAGALDKMREAMQGFIASIARHAQRQKRLERKVAALEAARARDLRLQTSTAVAIADQIETQEAILRGIPERTVSKEEGGMVGTRVDV